MFWIDRQAGAQRAQGLAAVADTQQNGGEVEVALRLKRIYLEGITAQVQPLPLAPLTAGDRLAQVAVEDPRQLPRLFLLLAQPVQQRQPIAPLTQPASTDSTPQRLGGVIAARSTRLMGGDERRINAVTISVCSDKSAIIFG